MLWLILANDALGAVAAGFGLGFDVPLSLSTENHGGEADHGSRTNPAAQMNLGWRQGLGPVLVQPELVVHVGTGDFSLFGAGGAVALASPLILGAYGHLGFPSYFGPAWDAGALAEVKVTDHVVPGMRVGYGRAQAVHAKCADCLQPSDHFLSAAAGVTFLW